jgi:hypothetical protein
MPSPSAQSSPVTLLGQLDPEELQNVGDYLSVNMA